MEAPIKPASLTQAIQTTPTTHYSSQDTHLQALNLQYPPEKTRSLFDRTKSFAFKLCSPFLFLGALILDMLALTMDPDPATRYGARLVLAGLIVCLLVAFLA